MPLFMPQDPPDAMGEFKPLGPPLPRTSEPEVVKPLYEKTGTDGILRNTETGKLETNFPEPKKSAITEQIQKVAREFIADLEAGTKQFQDEDLWLLKQLNSSDIEVNSIFAQSQQRVYSTPQQSGKSLIAEMYSRYGSQTNASQLFQEEKKLNGLTQVLNRTGESDELPDPAVQGKVRVGWEQLPKAVKTQFLTAHHQAGPQKYFSVLLGDFLYTKSPADEWTIELY